MLERSDYEQFRENIRRLAVDKIEPYAAEVDRDARFPEEALVAFRDLELASLPFAAKHGGQDGDILAQAICLEEVARVCASSSLTQMVNWAGLMVIHDNGGEQLLKETVEEAVKGSVVASICLTEPHGGSDLWGAKTTAKEESGWWVLKGQKRFISNATRSDWYVVLARTGDDSYGVFAVHKEDLGLSFGALERKMGVRGSPTADVILDDCRLPFYRCIGDPHQGYRYITDSLTYTRPMIAAQALGIAQGALDCAISYIKERRIFGKAVAEFQMTKGTIADLGTKIEAGRQLLYRSCEAVINDEPNARMLASMAKLLCSNVAMEAATEGVQLHGGAGYVVDYPAERMMRDAKITQIYEGTSEIQKLIIAKSLLSD